MENVTTHAGAGFLSGSGERERMSADHPRLPAQVIPQVPGTRLSGIAMRIAKGGRTRAGMADGGGERFEIALIDGSGRSVLHFGSYTEADIVAEWRRLAAVTGLPLMIESPDGVLSTPYPQIGHVAVGETHQRRRQAVLRDRRPRFLTRRKVGRFMTRPLVYREREIVSGMIG